MTAEELRQHVDEILAGSGDDEGAHSAEDKLHLELIRAFCPDWVVVEVNRLAAASFARWCA